MIDPHYLNVLRKICTFRQDCRSPWVITGSLGMSLQGMVMEVNDIDIQSDRDGALEIESRLSATVVEPVRCLVSERSLMQGVAVPHRGASFWTAQSIAPSGTSLPPCPARRRGRGRVRDPRPRERDV
jgi:hypothetical protein